MELSVDVEDPAEADRLLRTEVGVAVARRDVVRVFGPDTETFLQGQLSQDLAPFGDGDDGWSLLLQPQGKLVAHLRVSRAGPEEYLLDVAAGWGEAVVERLERFKLRTACELDLVVWDWLAYRGPGSTELELAAPIVATVDWAGVPGVDVIGPGVRPLPSAPIVAMAALEPLRIEAGAAVMGAELDERTIPAAAGIVADTVSFTKGCYTGQELVARIDSRGSNTPSRLHGVLIDSTDVPPLTSTLEVGGEEVGGLTSAAWSPARGAVVALAYVSRTVEPPVTGSVEPDGTPCRVVPLPISR